VALSLKKVGDPCSIAFNTLKHQGDRVQDKCHLKVLVPRSVSSAEFASECSSAGTSCSSEQQVDLLAVHQITALAELLEKLNQLTVFSDVCCSSRVSQICHLRVFLWLRKNTKTRERLCVVDKCVNNSVIDIYVYV